MTCRLLHLFMVSPDDNITDTIDNQPKIIKSYNIIDSIHIILNHLKAALPLYCGRNFGQLSYHHFLNTFICMSNVFLTIK